METCLIFSGGPHTKSLRSEQAVREARNNGAAIFAADSGANHAVEQYNIFPEIVFGDGDSIHEATRRILEDKGTLFDCSGATLLSIPEGQTKALTPSQKDQTDSRLALEYAVTHGIREITMIGGTSDNRVALMLANIQLLALFAEQYPQVLIKIISGKQTIWARRGPFTEVIHGKKGETFNIMPWFTDARVVKTDGLLYPLDNERLKIGDQGVSNVFIDNTATVSWKRRNVIVFIHEQAE